MLPSEGLDRCQRERGKSKVPRGQLRARRDSSGWARLFEEPRVAGTEPAMGEEEWNMNMFEIHLSCVKFSELKNKEQINSKECCAAPGTEMFLPNSLLSDTSVF